MQKGFDKKVFLGKANFFNISFCFCYCFCFVDGVEKESDWMRLNDVRVGCGWLVGIG
jgi:hypothetical protein